MRVLMITTSYPKYPGDVTAPVIEKIALELARRGHAVDLVLPRHPDLVLEGRDHGLPLRLIPFWAGSGKNYAWGYASSMRADRELRPRALALAPLVFLAGLATMRRLTRENRFDVAHAHWVLPNGPIAALAIAAETPLVISLHGSDIFVAERLGLLAAIARRTFQRTAWVAACASDLGTRAVALGAEPARVTTLLHGVDPEDLAGGDGIDWRARVGAARGDLFVATLGRLVAKKGFAHLIRATARLVAAGVPVRVAIGGTGDLAEPLAAEAAKLGVGRHVSFLGDVPHDHVGGLFRAADVVAVPSVRDENGNVDGLPNVLLEAMAVGSPVVASRIAGLPDVVVHDRNGLLVEPADEQALAEALRTLHADSATRSRLAAGALETARALSWQAYGDHLLEGYERVIAERRR